MKLSIKLSLLAASSSLLITSAFAAVYPVSKNSLYISGDVGYGNLATPSEYVAEPDGYVTGASYQTVSVAGGVNVGFNHVLQNNKILLGTEVGYDYNGQSKYTEDFLYSNTVTGKITSTDWHLLATGTYLFTNGLNVFAKAGGADVYQKLNVSGSNFTNTTYSTSETQIKPMVATGAGYQFKKVNVYAQYSHIFGKDANNFDDLFNSDGTFTGIVSVDTYKLGLAFNIAI